MYIMCYLIMKLIISSTSTMVYRLLAFNVTTAMACMYMSTYIHTYINTHIRARAHTHTCTHTHTRTVSHIHIYTVSEHIKLTKL